MVRFLRTDHLGMNLHTDVPWLSPDAQRNIADAHAGIADEFASIYRDGVKTGCFRPMPPMLVGRMMEGIIMTGGKVVMGADDPKGSVDEIAASTAETLVSALCPRP